jgi:hypothetical protein
MLANPVQNAATGIRRGARQRASRIMRREIRESIEP